MGFLKFAAPSIFDGQKLHVDSTLAIVTNESGVIEAVLPLAEAGDDVQHVQGLLCPGFVNAHCHLELSHLKGHIPQHTGMVPFLQQVMSLKRFRPDEKSKAMELAVAEMKANGVVAVGDISNNTDSIAIKVKSGLYFHNFIEISGFVPSTAAERLQQGQEVANAFLEVFPKDRVTIVPHAPYSVSKDLLENVIALAEGKLISFHVMESEAENEFFRDKQGDFMKLYADLGVHLDFFDAPGINSLRYLWPLMKHHSPWLLVHNTETGLHDLEWLAAAGVNWNDIYFCICPGANQYINYATPALHRFRHQYPLQLCLGTDSLAGNFYLNPLYEMRQLQRHGRLNDLAYLLQMATLNGAKALSISSIYGSFEMGSQPGILQITDIENNQQITAKSKVNRLL